MIRLRPAAERGHFNHGWLDTQHTFSFAHYYDPRHMAFRALRVINEDRIAPSQGFGTHGHEDMEILTWVLSGHLTHRDSMGHEQALGVNEIQRMSAGTGVLHSEYNASPTEPLHLLQIWLLPARSGHEPSYEQFAIDPAEKQNRWRTLASPEGGDRIARIHQDARLLVTTLDPGRELATAIDPARHAWLQISRGSVELNGQALTAGDGVAISNDSGFTLKTTSSEPSEVLFFDLA